MSFNITDLQNSVNQKVLGNEDQAAKTVAGNYDRYENILLQAYSVNTDNQSDINDIAEQIGGKDLKNANISAEQLQFLAKQKYERSQRIYTAFSQIMSTTHQLLLNLINKIGK